MEIKVININKHGQIFDPAHYKISREENPALYKFLEELSNAQTRKDYPGRGKTGA